METVLQGVYVTLGGTTDPGQNGQSEWIHARRTDRFNCSGHAHDRLYSTHCVHIGLDFHVSCPAIPIGELAPSHLQAGCRGGNLVVPLPTTLDYGQWQVSRACSRLNQRIKSSIQLPFVSANDMRCKLW